MPENAVETTGNSNLITRLPIGRGGSRPAAGGLHPSRYRARRRPSAWRYGRFAPDRSQSNWAFHHAIPDPFVPRHTAGLSLRLAGVAK